MDLDKIYQSTILEYSRIKDNKRNMQDATNVERGHNPNCGDDITLLLKIENNVIADASFLGYGCAISSASTNMLIELIINKTIEDAKKIIDTFFKMMKGEEVDEKELELIGDAEVLVVTANMPSRIKCSTLSWHSLRVIINKIEEEKS